MEQHQPVKEVAFKEKFDVKGLMKFLLPSLFGMFIFLFPVYENASFNIPLGIITEYLIELLSGVLPAIVTIVISFSTLLTLITVIFKPNIILKHDMLNSFFNVSAFWMVTRVLGSTFAIMTFYSTGWDLASSAVTGQVMFGLLTSLIVWFFVASYLMPYLVNFGVMEFFGTLFKNVTRPLFTLPGRSAIDLLASWIGNVNVGVVITREQHLDGFYTGREAAAIATCFSSVSLPFCLVIAGVLNIDHMFPLLYLTVCIAGVVSAVIIPRIPPLSLIPDTYLKENNYKEEVPKGVSSFNWGLQKAIGQAKNAGTFMDQIKQGTGIFLGIIFVLMPQVMAIGTTALMIAEFTPIFDIISRPLVPLLELMQIPEAAKAAPATIVGFIDMFIPSVLASGIEAEMTRFIIAGLSLVQIIYLSEMGTLIIISKIPLGVGRLFLIFMERTLISLPIIVLIAHIIY